MASKAYHSFRGYPLYDLLIDHWGPKLTAAYLLVVQPVGIIGGSGTILTYASQIAAFARDSGLPYPEMISQVHPRLNITIYSIGFLGLGSFLILLFRSFSYSKLNYLLPVGRGWIDYLRYSYFLPHFCRGPLDPGALQPRSLEYSRSYFHRHFADLHCHYGVFPFESQVDCSDNELQLCCWSRCAFALNHSLCFLRQEKLQGFEF